MPLLANKRLTYNSFHAFTRNDSGLGFSVFTRRYLRNRCCFLFHRLVICLSSAGRPCTAEVGRRRSGPPRGRKLETHETAGSLGPKPWP